MMETLLIENMCFRRFTSKVCLFLPLYTESNSLKILTDECRIYLCERIEQVFGTPVHTYICDDVTARQGSLFATC